MRKIKKTIAVFLAAIFVLAFAACGGDEKKAGGSVDENDKASGAPEGGEADDAETGTRSGYDLLPAEDYGGTDFVITNLNNYEWCDVTLDVEAAEAGDLLGDAIYRRNRAVEEKYNVNLKIIPIGYGELIAKVRNQINAGDCEYDIAQAPMLLDIAPLSVDGYIADANQLKSIDLSNPWWDDFAHSCSSIMGKQFFLFGDFTIADKEYANVIYFNRQLQQEFGLPDFYPMVREGTWTMDSMLASMKDITKDLDSDGKWTKNDRYGLLLNMHSKQAMFYGAGETAMKKKPDDVPYFVVGEEPYINAFTKIAEFLNCEHVADAQFKLGSHQDVMFAEGKGLFDASLLSAIRAPQGAQQGMEYDFGVLPTPKLDGKQGRYYSFMDGSTPCIAIINNDPERVERACVILEALNAKSSDEVQPKYKKYALPLKYFRDEESFEMLDIILESRLFDMAVIYGWGNFEGNSGLLRNLMANNKADQLVSTIEKNMDKAMEAMEKDLDRLMALN